jgi:cytochrome c-type biogenesis protein CcmF
VFLMAVGPLARWRDAPLPDLVQRLKWAALAAVVAAVIGKLAGSSLLAAFGILLAAWVFAATVVALLERTRNAQGNVLQRLARAPGLLPRGEWGMLLAHLGVAVFIFGVTMVKTFEAEKDVKMGPGDTATLGGYTFRMESLGQVQGPNYVALKAVVKASRDGREVATLSPEKRIYTAQQMPMTEAAIDTGVTRDLYVSIGEVIEGTNAYAVRVQVKPFVDWIWGGALLMALGGLLAATDRRYRAARQEKRAAAAHSALAGAKA